MKLLTWCTILVGIAVFSANADQVSPDPDDWYQNQYAPLWKDDPGDKLEEYLRFYDETIGYHSGDKAPVELVSRTWLTESLTGWASEGWTNSELTGYRSDRLNASTIVFKTKWRDEYADSSVEFSCSWYMADLTDDGWKFTQYADIDCAEHAL